MGRRSNDEYIYKSRIVESLFMQYESSIELSSRGLDGDQYHSIRSRVIERMTHENLRHTSNLKWRWR